MKIRFHIDYIDHEVDRAVIEEYLLDDERFTTEEIKYASDAALTARLNESEDVRQAIFDDYCGDNYYEVIKVEAASND